MRDARSKKSPLHSAFTWDVKKGFEKNLLTEARHMLNHFKFWVQVHENEPQEQRKYFFNVQVGEKITNRVYVGLDEVTAHPLTHAEIVGNFWRDAKRFYERYEEYKDFDELKAFMVALKKELNRRKK